MHDAHTRDLAYSVNMGEGGFLMITLNAMVIRTDFDVTTGRRVLRRSSNVSGYVVDVPEEAVPMVEKITELLEAVPVARISNRGGHVLAEDGGAVAALQYEISPAGKIAVRMATGQPAPADEVVDTLKAGTVVLTTLAAHLEQILSALRRLDSQLVDAIPELFDLVDSLTDQEAD